MPRRFFRRLFRFILLATLIFSIWACWYVYRKGFTRKWRQFVAAEFEKRGVEISFSRLTLDPVHGLVARDVIIGESKDHRETLARINRIALDINLNNFLRGKPFINALDLHDAHLWLPLSPTDPASPILELSHLNAHLVLSPNQIYLNQADAEIFGVHVSAAGRLINPNAYRSGESDGSGAKLSNQWLTKLSEQLKAFQFEGEPPRIDIQFSGDLVKPDEIYVQATLWAEKFRRHHGRLESLYLLLDYRDAVCSLKQLAITDSHGKLEASGTLKWPSGDAEVSLKSTLDLRDASELFEATSPLTESVFYTPPLLELSASGNVKSFLNTRISGRIAIQKFAVRSVVFDSLAANFQSDGKQWYLDEASLVHHSGALRWTAMQSKDGFRCRLQSSINPRDLRPFLSGKALEALSELDFEQSPQISLMIQGTAPDLSQCEMNGEMKLGRTRIRKVPLNSVQAKFHLGGGAFSLDPFKVTRDEGIATGAFTYDFAKREVRLDRIKTSITPVEAAVWIDRDLTRNVAPYKFKIPPNVALNGVVGIAGGTNTHLEVLVDAPNGMDYVFLKKTLTAQKVSGRLLFTEGNLRISDLDARIFSGRLQGSADISLKRGEPGHSAKVQVENIDFPALTKLYFNYDTSQGVLSGYYDFTGRGDDARTMNGQGNLSVVKGDVFAIPVLGPISGILNGIVPGMGYNVARQATASFNIKNGMISTDDFSVKGQGFEMIGGGKVYFLDDKINFNIRINATGLPGVLLFPVSKLFEYTTDSPLSKPSWRSAHLPGA